MSAYVDGNDEAFRELHGLLAPSVRGFFLRWFSDAAAADDLTQATFLKLHLARVDYQPRLPLRPWLFTIAARVRVDELRRRSREQVDDSWEAAVETLSSRMPRVDLHAELEREARVKAAVLALPSSRRVVIQLHRFEGRTFKEIAQVLGTTEAAVRVRAVRAYAQLRVELAGILDEDEGP